MVRQCKGQTTSGDPCSAQPVRDDGFCFWHSPSTAEERAESRRRGGQNRSNRARARKQLPAGVLTVNEVRGLLGKALRDVLAGTLEPGPANAAAAIARSYLAACEASAVEALERDVAELRSLIAARGLA